eukprot:1183287-Prorocentrum_minimum.AAC.1
MSASSPSRGLMSAPAPGHYWTLSTLRENMTRACGKMCPSSSPRARFTNCVVTAHAQCPWNELRVATCCSKVGIDPRGCGCVVFRICVITPLNRSKPLVPPLLPEHSNGAAWFARKKGISQETNLVYA